MPPLTLPLHCFSFDASKSTKGASKLRRDLINSEIANLRDLLPLPSSTRQRLSQLQLMALVCVYVRKANYFHHGQCCIAMQLMPASSPLPLMMIGEDECERKAQDAVHRWQGQGAGVVPGTVPGLRSQTPDPRSVAQRLVRASSESVHVNRVMDVTGAGTSRGARGAPQEVLI